MEFESRRRNNVAECTRSFMVEAEYIEKDECFRAVIMQLLSPTCILLAVRETIDVVIERSFFVNIFLILTNHDRSEISHHRM